MGLRDGLSERMARMWRKKTIVLRCAYGDFVSSLKNTELVRRGGRIVSPNVGLNPLNQTGPTCTILSKIRL